MATTTQTSAIYWDLDHLNPQKANDIATGYELQPGSTLANALAQASVQRALGGARTIESSLARALERAGVELIETCGHRSASSRCMAGFVETAANDMALNAGIDTVVLVSMRSDVGELARFVRRSGRRFVQLRRAGSCKVEAPMVDTPETLAA